MLKEQQMQEYEWTLSMKLNAKFKEWQILKLHETVQSNYMHPGMNFHDKEKSNFNNSAIDEQHDHRKIKVKLRDKSNR